MSRPLSACCSVLVLLAAALPAQAAPSPAPELKKLEPLLGNWAGKGSMVEPTGVTTDWEGEGTCAWALDGHFLREDFVVRFSGQDTPMVKRRYLGWDREQGRYVAVDASNAGAAVLNTLELQPDGALVELMLMQHPGARFALRSTFKVTGDAMTHTVDVLMASGASMALVDGKFTRGGKGFAGDFGSAPFMGATPHASLARLAKAAGDYEVKGTVTMLPGQPPMKITGVDTFRSAFGGVMFLGTTVGEAEGVPGKYLGEVFWAHRAERDCLVGVYVSNFGEAMEMEARWSDDGKLVSTSAGTFMKQPVVQRMLMEFDAAGAAVAASSHSIAGTAAPFESFKATYTKKK
jgi:hypothetical protein